MSDVDIRSKVENKKPRKKHVITDGHREAMKANLDKARKVRTQKCAERKLTKNEDAILLKELIAEKKRLKNSLDRQTTSDSDSSPRREASFPSSQAPNLEQTARVSSESEESQSEEDVSDSESEESESEESESSSDDDAEFVLTRKKAIAKKKVEPKARAVKKEKESMLEKMEQMTAELAALKKQKKKSSKVNVYVNQEKPKRTTEQQKALLDL